MVRQWLATFAMGSARKFGRALGCELVVEVSDHSIKTTMEVPDTSKRAWDGNLFRRGQLFVKGYANPIKPRIIRHDDREELDEVDVEEGDGAADAEDDRRLELIPSTRYREYLNQHLISELVNPQEQWQLLVYGIIALGVLLFVNMIVTLHATGSF